MAVVVLDPGHYEAYNPGTCPGYYEGNTMLTLSQFLGAMLTEMGATVRYTRTSNSQNPTLAQRGAMGAGADLFLSLHSDANDNPDARGVTAFYSVRQPESEPFASAIGQATAKAMGNQFRGAVARPSETTPGQDYLGVIRAAVAAGAKNAFLMENGFHTNPEDCAVLNSNAGLMRIAGAQAQTIGRWLGLNVPAAGENLFYYTVQPGEYLYLIGQKFGVPWQSIAAANGLTPPYTLMPGRRIAIPVPTA